MRRLLTQSATLTAAAWLASALGGCLLEDATFSCSDLACEDRNRTCIEGNRARDATCGECLDGFVPDGRSCVPDESGWDQPGPGPQPGPSGQGPDRTESTPAQGSTPSEGPITSGAPGPTTPLPPPDSSTVLPPGPSDPPSGACPAGCEQTCLSVGHNDVDIVTLAGQQSCGIRNGRVCSYPAGDGLTLSVCANTGAACLLDVDTSLERQAATFTCAANAGTCPPADTCGGAAADIAVVGCAEDRLSGIRCQDLGIFGFNGTTCAEGGCVAPPSGDCDGDLVTCPRGQICEGASDTTVGTCVDDPSASATSDPSDIGSPGPQTTEPPSDTGPALPSDSEPSALPPALSAFPAPTFAVESETFTDISVDGGYTYDAIVFWPDESPAVERPLIIFAHGFRFEALDMVPFAEALASHGFVVVLPDVGDAGGFLPASRDHELLARDISFVIDWVITRNQATSSPIRRRIDPSRIGVGGHARGGKAAIWAATRDNRIGASWNLDPVDNPPQGPGGTGGTTPSVAPELMDGFTIPGAFLGSGFGPIPAGSLSPACAPDGENHLDFFESAAGPALSLVLEDAGQTDFIARCHGFDTESGPMECRACLGGSTPEWNLDFATLHQVAFYKVFLEQDERFRPWVDGAPVQAMTGWVGNIDRRNLTP